MELLQILISEYFDLEKGIFIAFHEEKIYVGSVCIYKTDHTTYISRRSFKHFIERRKEDFMKKHTEEESKEIIRKMMYDVPHNTGII